MVGKAMVRIDSREIVESGDVEASTNKVTKALGQLTLRSLDEELRWEGGRKEERISAELKKVDLIRKSFGIDRIVGARSMHDIMEALAS